MHCHSASRFFFCYDSVRYTKHSKRFVSYRVASYRTILVTSSNRTCDEGSSKAKHRQQRVTRDDDTLTWPYSSYDDVNGQFMSLVSAILS